MIALLCLLAVLVALWMWRRRARAGVLAGRDSSRPVYSVEPPRRRVSGLKDQRL